MALCLRNCKKHQIHKINGYRAFILYYLLRYFNVWNEIDCRLDVVRAIKSEHVEMWHQIVQNKWPVTVYHVLLYYLLQL